MKRNQETTHGQLLRTELGQSVDHALRAAGYAAGGVRATVGPRVAPAARRVRGAAATGWRSTRTALAPLGEAARRRVTPQEPEQQKAPRRRWPRMAGLLAGGAAVGAAAAFVMRRRRQRQWEEYDPTEAVAGVGGSRHTTGGADPTAEAAGAGPESTGGGPGTTPPGTTPPVATGVPTPVVGRTPDGPADRRDDRRA